MFTFRWGESFNGFGLKPAFGSVQLRGGSWSRGRVDFG